MTYRKPFLSAAMVAFLAVGSTGCEIIAAVDRTHIDDNIGGSGVGTCVPMNDANECTDDVCNADGTTAHTPKPMGTACSTGGAQCDGNGQCVECIVADDCPGTDDECQTRTCNAGACGFDFTAADTAVSMQSAGDCKEKVCDGNGAMIDKDNDADVPDDSNPCTTDTCAMGTVSHTNLPVGTGCGMSGNGDPLVCNDMGQCIGCNTAADCGTDDECKTYTCTAGVCGVDYAATNTPVLAQTNNDCLVHVCDGAGNFVDIADDSDLPLDDGNACTSEACNAGMPTHPNVADGSGCDDNDACTMTDSCQMGVCTGANPVTCMASDQCHDVGMCDPMTGLCSDPAKANDSPCDDSDLCTQTDSCQAGVCTGANPVVCMPLDTCHLVGTCSPGTGTCDDPVAPDGTACMSGGSTGTCSVGMCALCGNNTVDPGEVCDDGNTGDGDGCSANCLSDESCGNQILDTTAGETCDDGNTVDSDGCSSVCAAEPYQICSTNVPTGILDNMTVMSTLNAMFPYVISSIDVELEITHSSLDDLTINLSQGSTTVLLADNFDNQMGPGNACTGDDMTAILDDEAATALESACVEPGPPAIDGRYRPKGMLANFVGTNIASSAWTMSVLDGKTGDVGSIDRWCLNLNGFGVSAPTVYWARFNTGVSKTEVGSGIGTTIITNAGASALAVDPTTRKLYYSKTGGIAEADADGTNSVDIVSTGTSIGGIAVDSTNAKLYWSEFNNNRVMRSDLNGANQQVILTGIDSVSGVAIDSTTGKVFVITYNNTTMYSANLDGTGQQTIITGIGGQGVGVAVDPTTQKLYYGTRSGAVFVANEDGTNPTAFITGESGPTGVAIDVAGGKLYWAAQFGNKIRRANLADGSNVEDVSPATSPWHIAFMPVQ